jgi:hypothetical protein
MVMGVYFGTIFPEGNETISQVLKLPYPLAKQFYDIIPQ